MGLYLSGKEQRVIGINASNAYHSVFNSMPEKEPVKVRSTRNGGRKLKKALYTIYINKYPVEFAPIIVNCILDYIKNNQKK